MPSGSNMNRLECQSKNKASWVQGWLESLSHPEVTLSHPEVPAQALNLRAKKTSGLAYKFHQIAFWMIHTAACDQATGDRRGQDAPVLPTRGRWSRLRHAWASNQWKNYIKSMDYRFLKKWYRIFCRFLSLWSHYHDIVTCQSLCFCSAKAAVNCVLRKFAKSLFGSAWIWQSSKPPKFPVPFFKIRDEVAAENWLRFHQISKLNKLAVMALICPRLYFFMAHQCSTWCPSSIGKGRGFGFLPPRETTISIQQAPEVPGITAHDVLSVSPCFFKACL